MLKRLRNGKALLIEKKSGTRSIYRLRVKSTSEIIFVLASQHMVFTAWPPNKHLKLRGRELAGEPV
jgi:hypothetical protein